MRACARCGSLSTDDVSFCGNCGAPLPKRVIVREAGGFRRSYRARSVGLDKAIYLGVRVTVAFVIILAAVYLMLMMDCITIYDAGGQILEQTCTPDWDFILLGVILLVGGIILLVYSIARTALG